MSPEQYDAYRTMLWGEILQLVQKEGPLVDEMDKVLIGRDESTIPEGTRESLVAHMVAHRCAMIAAADERSEFFNDPTSIVLGKWAGWSLDQEARQTILTEEILGLLARLRSAEMN